jgi:predicted DNA-binding transcriptional regulator AlpA
MLPSRKDLEIGIQVGVKVAELLTGKKIPTIYRRIHEGTFCPFRRDPFTGRISFDSRDILAFIESQPKHKSTSEYERTPRIQAAENARKSKGERKW